jgi:hypothetical protein
LTKKLHWQANRGGFKLGAGARSLQAVVADAAAALALEKG